MEGAQVTPDGSRSRIGLLSAGGTIEAVGASRLDQAWYNEAAVRLEPGRLLESIAELEDIADIRPIPFRRLSSRGMTMGDWLDLARAVEGELDGDGLDGIVVTHGTNALEEIAFFLDLLLPHGRPVVFVGAMRPSSALGADGYLNLYRGVQVAASADAVGKGVLVVMNDTIHAARDVTKTSTFRVDALDGRDLGPLGFADADGEVIFYHQRVRGAGPDAVFPASGLTEIPRVDIVVSYVGADGAMIDAAVRAGSGGIVSAGWGAGRSTHAEELALERAAEAGVVVCQASRVGSGRVVRSPSLEARGWVAADNLVPWKARILLALALTRSRDPDQIQRLFGSV